MHRLINSLFDTPTAAIPGAELRIIPGMGHDLPPGLYDTFVDANGATLRLATPTLDYVNGGVVSAAGVSCELHVHAGCPHGFQARMASGRHLHEQRFARRGTDQQ